MGKLAWMGAALLTGLPALGGAAGAQPSAAQPKPSAVQPAPVAAQPKPPAAQPTPPAPAAPFDPNAIRGSIQVCAAARGEHRVRLEAGRHYAISATSPDFDPFLRLLRPGSELVIAEDDDSGGGVTPRLSFTPPETGDYVVRVSSFAPGSAGTYALSVTPQAPLPALVTRPAAVQRAQWQIFDGALTDVSASAFGRRFTDYQLALGAGETAMIHVQGQRLDTQLQLFGAGARSGAPLAQDDDGGGGKDPFLFFTAPQTGTYAVRVIGFDETARGAYRLRIGR